MQVIIDEHSGIVCLLIKWPFYYLKWSILNCTGSMRSSSACSGIFLCLPDTFMFWHLFKYIGISIFIGHVHFEIFYCSKYTLSKMDVSSQIFSCIEFAKDYQIIIIFFWILQIWFLFAIDTVGCGKFVIIVIILHYLNVLKVLKV